MSHKRVVEKRGKTYGPYLYESYRDADGKVRKRYLGKVQENTNTYKTIIGLLVFALVICLLVIGNWSLTGRATLSVDEISVENGTLTGKAMFVLQQSELIPADTQVIITHGDFEQTYSLNDLVLETPIEGDFFIEGTDISGSGFGYSTSSEKFPEVNFVLGIYAPKGGSSYTIPENETQEPLPENQTEEPEEIPQENETEESGTRTISGNSIRTFFTGMAIDESQYELIDEINASVRYNETFVYDLDDDETADIISSEQDVDLSIENNQAIVSTDYLGEDSMTLEIDIEALNITAVNGDLVISFVYNGTEIDSATTEITLEESLEALNATNETNETNITLPRFSIQVDNLSYVILNASAGKNQTTENLTVYTNQDANASLKLVRNWYRNGTSIALINLPFEGGSNSTWTREYAYGKNATVVLGVWNSTAGQDGKGGYIFNSSANSLYHYWNNTTTSGAPTARRIHTAVWNGTHMIIFGGLNNLGVNLNTGGRYDPITNTWNATSTSGVPARSYHTAVWAGNRMIVWGGYNNTGYTFTGGVYDPIANTWTTTNTTNAPIARAYHTAVWTGTKMIVWGGEDSGLSVTNTGGVYDPITNTWTDTNLTNAPVARKYHTAVWTGTKMIVWGGTDASSVKMNSGGIYDPVTNTWTNMTTSGAPTQRYWHSAIWTGTEMIIWGGQAAALENTGKRYNPVTNTWGATTSTTNAPFGRYGHYGTYINGEMIIWGGWVSGDANDGGHYNVATNTWTATNNTSAPIGRTEFSGVTTKDSIIVWGGYNGGLASPLNTGGKYYINSYNGASVSVNNQSLNSEGTISAWIYPTNASDSRGEGIVTNLYTSLSQGVGIELRANDISFLVKNSTAGGCNITTTSDVIQNNNWYHIVGVWNSSNCTLYINNQLNGSSTPSSVFDIIGEDLRIGAYNYADDHFFNGTIDDVLVFNESISREQISVLYNIGTKTIVSNETEIGETWQACVTPNDLTEDGNTTCSNNLTIFNSSALCNTNISSDTLLVGNLSCLGTALTIITNNTVLDCNGSYLIGNASGYGVDTYGNQNITIKNCWIQNFSNGVGSSKTAGAVGVYLYKNNVTNNTLFNNTYGVRQITQCNVIGNNISGGQRGIDISSSPAGSYNLVTGNRITNNSAYGIYMFDPSYNNISNNYFDNPSVNLYHSSGTGNNFNATYNCSIPGYMNIFGGPCQGGNYWANYTGTDDGSGVYPHNISGDGIGDTNIPYNSSMGSSGDYLPLTSYEPDIDSENASQSEWWMFHRFLNHTGYTPLTGPTDLSENISSFKTGNTVASSPAVANGVVYVGSNDNRLYALNASNISQKLGEYNVGANIQSSPAFANGIVYFGSVNYRLYALNASNVSQELGQYNTGAEIYSSPAVANGVVYIGSHSNKLYALNASNVSQELGNYTTGGNIGSSSPAVADEVVYVGSVDNKIYALNASNVSQQLGNYTTGDDIHSSPAVANGVVYIGSNDNKIYALNASNVSQMLSFYPASSHFQSSPAVADEVVYVGSDDKRLYALNASNVSQILSSYITGGNVYSSPAVANGVVYIGSNDERVYAFGSIAQSPLAYLTIVSAKVNTSSGNNYTTEDILCWANATNFEGSNLSYIGYWHKNGEQNLSFNTSAVEYVQGDFALASTLLSGNTTMGENWSCNVSAYSESEYSDSVMSDNLTVVNQAPNMIEAFVNSTTGNNLTTENLTCYANATDGDGDNVSYSGYWYVNGAQNLSFSTAPANYTQGTLVNVSTLLSGNTTIGENWSCNVTAYDGTNYSTSLFSDNLTVMGGEGLLNITLLSPANYNATNASSTIFNCSANSTLELSSLTLQVWNSTGLIYSNTSSVSGTYNYSTFNASNLTNGILEWNCLGYSSFVNATADNNYTLIKYTNLTNVPSILLINPENASTKVNNNVTFIYEAYSVIFSNLTCSLVLDNETVANSSEVYGRDLIYYNVSDGNHTWRVLCIDNESNAGTSLEYEFNVNTSITDSSDPLVDLQFPANNHIYYSLSSINVSFVYNASDDYGDLNCTFYSNISGSWQANENHTSYAVGNEEWISFIYENVSTNNTYIWNVLCSDSSGNSAFNSNNFTFIMVEPGDCQCSSCSDCQTRLSDLSCATVTVTDDFNYTGNDTCISKIKIGRQESMIFDGDGHVISGVDGDGTGILFGGGGLVDIFIVMDTSGSMESGGKLESAKDAAATFVDEVSLNYSVGLVEFDSDANVVVNLTTNHTAVRNGIFSLYYDGGWTGIGLGAIKAVDNYNLTDTNRTRVMILLSDGKNNRPENNESALPIPAAYYAAENNVTIYTIAYGGDADTGLMKQIAEITGGEYFFSPSNETIRQTYLDIVDAFVNVINHEVKNMTVQSFRTCINLTSTDDSELNNITLYNCSNISLSTYESDSNRIQDFNILDTGNTGVNMRSSIGNNFTRGYVNNTGTGDGFFVYYSNNTSFYDVGVYYGDDDGFYIQSNATLFDNVTSSRNYDIGIEFYRAYNNTLNDLTLEHNNNAIKLAYSNRSSFNNVFVNNTTGTGTNYGIYLRDYSERNNFTNLTVLNGEYGFYLTYADWNIFDNVTSNNNSYRGFYTDAYADNLTLSNFVVENNSYEGIYMQGNNNNLTNITANYNGLAFGYNGISVSGRYYRLTNITTNNNGYYGLQVSGVSPSVHEYDIIENVIANNNTLRGVMMSVNSSNISNVVANYNQNYSGVRIGIGNIRANNISANYNPRGIEMFSYLSVLTNSSAINNTDYSYYIGDPLYTYTCRNTIKTDNVGGVDGKPFLYVNDTTSYTVANTSNYSQIEFCNVNNSIINNVTISNPGATSDGILLLDSQNINITDSNISDVYQGIYLLTYYSPTTTYNLTNNTFDSIDTYGIRLSANSANMRANISRNNISNMPYAIYTTGIGLAPTYNNNRFMNISNIGITCSDSEQIKDNYFENNNVSVSVYGSNLIEGNTFFNGTYAVYSSSFFGGGTTVRNNSIENQTVGVKLSSDPCDGLSMADCLNKEYCAWSGSYCEYGGSFLCSDTFDGDSDSLIDCSDPDCTYISPCGTKPAHYIYWNNFTNNSLHADSFLSGDEYNTTASGQAQGNLWDDAYLLDIYDTTFDIWGDSGTDYPYADYNGGNVNNSVYDYGPIVQALSIYVPSIQCEINTNGNWSNCSNASYDLNITRVRVNCSDNVGTITNASFVMKNLPDSYTFFNVSNATEISGDWWIYDNADIFVRDGGEWQLNVTCRNNFSQSQSNYTNWTLPWGNLSGVLITNHSNVTKHEFFNFSAQVTCVGGECGNVTSIADPEPASNGLREILGDRQVQDSCTYTYCFLTNYYYWDDAYYCPSTGFCDYSYANCEAECSGGGECGYDASCFGWSGGYYCSLNSECYYDSGECLSLCAENCNDLVVESLSDNYFQFTNGPCTANISTSFVKFTSGSHSNECYVIGDYSDICWESYPCVALSGEYASVSDTFNIYESEEACCTGGAGGECPAEDSDGDGIPDSSDTMFGNQTEVYTYGITNLTFTVNGTYNESPSGLNNVSFFADGVELVRFEWNFNTSNVLNMSLIDIYKTANGVYLQGVNISKTLYVPVGAANGICIKNANGVVAYVMACNGTGEYFLSDANCNGSAITLNGDSVTCTISGGNYVLSGLTHSGGEAQTKGVIPMNSGTPFYTISDNPDNDTCTSMYKDDICNITWSVNATGNTTGNSTWKFYATFNATQYSGVSNNTTDIINITIVEANIAPTHANPVLNSTNGTNLTTENLTVYNQSTADSNDDAVKNIINWYIGNDSYYALNMPFEGGSNSTFTKDYSNHSNGTVALNGTGQWNSSGGYDGFGAYQFDGDGDYIDLGDEANLNLTSNITLAVWIKTNSSYPGNVIAKYGINTLNRSYRLTTNLDFAGKITFRLSSDGTALSANLTSATNVTDNLWHFVVVSYNGSIVSMYIDGVLENSTAYSGGIWGSQENVYIGTEGEDSHISFFNGSIDEVLILDRGLSAGEAGALYNNRTDLIVSNETLANEIWQACITPNDKQTDGIELCSNNLTVLSANNPPFIVELFANSTTGNNITTDNLTCYVNATDSDLDNVSYSGYWYLNGAQNLIFNTSPVNYTQGALVSVSTLLYGNTSKGQNWSCNVTAYDGANYSSYNLSNNITILNSAPYFNPNLTNQTVAENETLYYDINCSDIDNDSLTYYINDSTEFSINSSNGLINWTTGFNDSGNYSYLITCGDGTANVSQQLNITVRNVNNPPNIVVAFVNSTYGTNRTNENITCWANVTDLESSYINYSGVWYKNGLQQFDKWNTSLVSVYYDTRTFVETDKNDNIITSNNPGNYSGRYVNISKFDSDGALLWSNNFNGTYITSYSLDIDIDSNDNIIFAGGANLTGTNSGGIVYKYDSSGNKLWNNTPDGPLDDGLQYVKVNSNGDIIAVGQTYSFGAGNADTWVIKYDSDGNKLWNTTFGGTDHESTDSLELDGDDNIVIGGHTYSFGAGQWDFFIVKYDSDGNKLWNTTFGGTSSELSGLVAIDKNNNIAITGYTNSFGVGGYDILTVKYYSNGTKQWNITFGGVNTDYASGISFDENNDLFVSGYTDSFGVGGYDILTVKYYSNGTQAWNKTAGGSDYDSSSDMKIGSDNNPVVLGTYSGFSDSDVLILRYNNSDGGVLANTLFGDVMSDSASRLTLDKKDNIIFSYSSSNSSIYNLAIAKLYGFEAFNKTVGMISNVSTIDSSQTTVGDNWSCFIKSYDGDNYSNYHSSDNITIIDIAHVFNASIVYPTGNISIINGDSFNVTARIYCNGTLTDYCTNISATLDPYKINDVNLTGKTCSEQWGFDCSVGPPESGDNTFDSCNYGDGADESVVEMYLNSTTVNPGAALNITCTFDQYDELNDDSGIFYYNGTGWKILWQGDPCSGDCVANKSIEFTADDVEGTHWIRCAIQYNDSSPLITDYCAIGDYDYQDNDDISFTVEQIHPVTINSILTSPLKVGENSEINCVANVTAISTTLDAVYFNITLANSTIVQLGNGTRNGDNWTSGSYVIPELGSYACNVSAIDNESNTANDSLEFEAGDIGIIPMNSGNPFYTVDYNPSNATYLSCLNSLQGGSYCDVIWNVTANATAGTTWSFFAFFNGSYVETERINVTVLSSNNPPVINSVLVNSTYGTNLSNESLNCYANATDADADNVSYSGYWYKNGGQNISFSTGNFSSGSLTLVSTLLSGNTSVADNWSCYVRAYDNENYSSYLFSNNLTILPSIVCGNGIVEAGESCDLTNLSGETCVTQGYDTGTLSCTASCTFNTSECATTPSPPGPGGCSDQCSPFGTEEYECVNSTYSRTRDCGNYDADSCNEWSDWTIEDCSPGTCENDTCVGACVEDWNCTAFTSCYNGIRTRICIDLNDCGTEINKPEEQVSCECLEDWDCQWTLCVGQEDYSYAYDCVDNNNCGTEYDKPDRVRCSERETTEYGCDVKWNCTNWGLCEIDLSLDDLIDERIIQEGVQKRLCIDELECAKDIEEKMPCEARVDIRASKTKWCEEDYVEIYEKSTGKLVSRVKESEKIGFLDLEKVDIDFLATEFTYCDYCYDGVKDYDETDVDCGGPNCPECVLISPFFDWLKWLLIFLWASIIIFTATIVWEERQFIAMIIREERRRRAEEELLKGVEEMAYYQKPRIYPRLLQKSKDVKLKLPELIKKPERTPVYGTKSEKGINVSRGRMESRNNLRDVGSYKEQQQSKKEWTITRKLREFFETKPKTKQISKPGKVTKMFKGSEKAGENISSTRNRLKSDF